MWNPARGCHKVKDRHPLTGERVSECEFCYMKRNADGLFKFNHNQVAQTSTKLGGAFTMPLRLPRVPAKVFTASLTDFFHKDLDSFREQAWEIIRSTPHLTYQILTKRPQNIARRLPSDWGTGYENVWLGVSAGYQHTAVKRIPLLLAVPAKVYFVSAEPLLEAVDLAAYLPQLDWVIVGGESSNKEGFYRYRPRRLEWMDTLVKACQRAGVACWVKQLGTQLQDELGLRARHGTDLAEWPVGSQVQQFPDPLHRS